MKWLIKILNDWFLDNPHYFSSIILDSIESYLLAYAMFFVAFLISVIFCIKGLKKTKRITYILPFLALATTHLISNFTPSAKELWWWIAFAELLLSLSLLTIKSKERAMQDLCFRSPIILIALIDIGWYIKETIVIISKYGGYYASYASSGYTYENTSNYYKHVFLLFFNLGVIAAWLCCYFAVYRLPAIQKRIKEEKEALEEKEEASEEQ